ncbi:hypothetical protein HK101_011037, partial [Irineochytrium annulatum]
MSEPRQTTILFNRLKNDGANFYTWESMLRNEIIGKLQEYLIDPTLDDAGNRRLTPIEFAAVEDPERYVSVWLPNGAYGYVKFMTEQESGTFPGSREENAAMKNFILRHVDPALHSDIPPEMLSAYSILLTLGTA